MNLKKGTDNWNGDWKEWLNKNPDFDDVDAYNHLLEMIKKFKDRCPALIDWKRPLP